MDKNIYAISYKMRRELYHRIISVFVVIVAFFFFVSLFLSFVLFPVQNKSDSMSPDIVSGGMEFVTPLLKNPERGDVILLRHYENGGSVSLPKKFAATVCRFVSAGKWNPFEKQPAVGTRPVIRRVVGMPGDTIYIDRYVVFVQPAGQSHFLTEFEVSETKYNVKILVPPAGWDVELGAKSSMGEIVLGKNEYFVLGDDRISAADSRIWGPVRQDAVLGTVVMQYFPFDKIALF